MNELRSNRLRTHPPRRVHRGLAALTAAWALSAGAAIDNGNGDLVDAIGDPELVLVIWDPAREASYALDLGLRSATLLDVGRSDAGHQQFWTLDRALDLRLDKLLDLGSAIDSLRWGVFGVDVNGFDGLEGDLRLFTTLEHTTPTGTVNPNYTTLVNLDNSQGFSAISSFDNSLVSALNNDASNPDNTHGALGAGSTADNYAFHGSAYTVIGQAGYFGSAFGQLPNLGLNPGPATTNTIGRSSWAYYLTQGGAFDNTLPVLLDEFDNLEHDAFWGLAQDPGSGILYLSFTLDAVGMSAAERSFAAGIGRTEFGGGFAVRPLTGIAVAAGMESPTGYARALGAAVPAIATLAPVPEPGTWALMALGLAAVGAAARRRA